MLRNAALTVTTIFFLTGCAGTGGEPQRVTLPSGQGGYMINCADTPISSTAECVVKAGEICPSGYKVVSQDTRRGADGYRRKSMLIECNREAGRIGPLR